MKYYNLDVKEVLEDLDTSKEGLSKEKASKKLEMYGNNKLVEAKKVSNIVKFLNEFKDLMIVVLLIASIFSFVLAKVNNESYIDSIIIIAIVILNAILGFVQELRADQAIEALKNMQVTKSRVRRDGKIKSIDSENIVPGDIILLEAGDTVPADARIIWQSSLQVNESSLTGESLPVKKSIATIKGEASLDSITNMVFTGTDVVYGKCEAVVVATGMNTEFGKIAESLNSEEKDTTPLQEKITDISKTLSIIILIIIMIMFLIGIIKGMQIKEIVMLSISLAVAAIPEGLPAVITIILSLGMNDLAKKNAIVRKMASVETLGSTEIICSDKTGTITQNKMTVREVYFNGKITDVDKLPKENVLFDSMVLNNDVYIDEQGYIGDPTEVALYECLIDKIDIIKTRKLKARIDEIPFDSDRKMMSTINQYGDSITLYTKGSFDSVIEHSKYYLENEKVVKLTKEKKEELKNIEKEESSKAYRILAYAYKKLDSKYKIDDNLEDDLVFVGMTSMIDPPRPDVKEAIALCKRAHIKPIMITGDSLATAVSIAKEIGILESEEEACTGLELDSMSEEQIMDAVTKYSVYARVSPINKLDIVEAFKKHNKIVAMTGDGVNDAPALKVANIGVGMGITGTEVSKGVSDIVLVDDSFSTIVRAVKEGRRIFDNIRNVLTYLLAGNIAEILIVFVGMLFGIEVFLPIQLLYLNLITDSLPAIALAFEKADENIMDRNVRKNDTFFTPFLLAKIMLSATLKTIAVLSVYFIDLKLFNVEIASSMTFLTLIMLEMIYSFSCKNLKKNIFTGHALNNKYLNGTMILLIIVQIIVFTTPIRYIFDITKLGIVEVLISILMVVSIFLIDEITKPLIVKLFKD
ncbi:MAG: cation-translocating P-type ATPase [Bacilli bacterium]|nr:cation-translocating P-type ATPase [Bacilli bacterium]